MMRRGLRTILRTAPFVAIGFVGMVAVSMAGGLNSPAGLFMFACALPVAFLCGIGVADIESHWRERVR